jgi:hypothetical protein
VTAYGCCVACALRRYGPSARKCCLSVCFDTRTVTHRRQACFGGQSMSPRHGHGARHTGRAMVQDTQGEGWNSPPCQSPTRAPTCLNTTTGHKHQHPTPTPTPKNGFCCDDTDGTKMPSVCFDTHTHRRQACFGGQSMSPRHGHGARHTVRGVE